MHVLLVAALSAGLMGPPAPSDEPPKPRRVYSQEERDRARSAWKWYALGFTVDLGTTLIALDRGGQESNPLGLKATFVVKGLGAVLAYDHGRRRPERVPWLVALFLSLSVAAGAWNLSVAF